MSKNLQVTGGVIIAIGRAVRVASGAVFHTHFTIPTHALESIGPEQFITRQCTGFVASGG